MDINTNINRHLTISKDELSQLPMATFDGKIVVIDNPEQVDVALDKLEMEKEIGFDTETKPSFKRGQTFKVSLVQLSTHNTCYLFRLNHIGMPERLKNLLGNEDILKIGVSIHDDFHNLQKLADITPAGFVDLQSFVKQYHIADNSLSKIYAIVFGQRISKAQRLTNWEAAELTQSQQNYAALDAYACVKLYDTLVENKFDAVDSPYWHIIPTPGDE